MAPMSCLRTSILSLTKISPMILKQRALYSNQNVRNKLFEDSLPSPARFSTSCRAYDIPPSAPAASLSRESSKPEKRDYSLAISISALFTVAGFMVYEFILAPRYAKAKAAIEMPILGENETGKHYEEFRNSSDFDDEDRALLDKVGLVRLCYTQAGTDGDDVDAVIGEGRDRKGKKKKQEREERER